MTQIQFRRSRGRIEGFTCSGHSGFAGAGADIVCAAVTSAVRLAECTINDVLRAGAEVFVDPSAAQISLTLSPTGKSRKEAEDVLEGLFLYTRELSIENPDYLTILEV